MPKSNLVHHHIVLANQKSSPEELKITAVEMQELPETEKTVFIKNILPEIDKIKTYQKNMCKFHD